MDSRVCTLSIKKYYNDDVTVVAMPDKEIRLLYGYLDKVGYPNIYKVCQTNLRLDPAYVEITAVLGHLGAMTRPGSFIYVI